VLKVVQNATERVRAASQGSSRMNDSTSRRRAGWPLSAYQRRWSSATGALCGAALALAGAGRRRW
jgi:hypothetical protein